MKRTSNQDLSICDCKKANLLGGLLADMRMQPSCSLIALGVLFDTCNALVGLGWCTQLTLSVLPKTDTIWKKGGCTRMN